MAYGNHSFPGFPEIPTPSPVLCSASDPILPKRSIWGWIHAQDLIRPPHIDGSNLKHWINHIYIYICVCFVNIMQHAILWSFSCSFSAKTLRFVSTIDLGQMHWFLKKTHKRLLQNYGAEARWAGPTCRCCVMMTDTDSPPKAKSDFVCVCACILYTKMHSFLWEYWATVQ